MWWRTSARGKRSLFGFCPSHFQHGSHFPGKVAGIYRAHPQSWRCILIGWHELFEWLSSYHKACTPRTREVISPAHSVSSEDENRLPSPLKCACFLSSLSQTGRREMSYKGICVYQSLGTIVCGGCSCSLPDYLLSTGRKLAWEVNCLQWSEAGLLVGGFGGVGGDEEEERGAPKQQGSSFKFQRFR